MTLSQVSRPAPNVPLAPPASASVPTPVTMGELQQGDENVRALLEQLDASESSAILKSWRYRLVQMCDGLEASPLRREWLLHSILQTHDLRSLLDLIGEFNQLQMGERSQASGEAGHDFIRVNASDTGLYLGILNLPTRNPSLL